MTTFTIISDENQDLNGESDNNQPTEQLKKREMSTDMPLLQSPDYLIEAPLDDVLEILVPHLSSSDRRLQSATLLLERIRSDIDNDQGIKQILRSIALHSEPHPIVTEQVVQLLYVVDSPEIVIDVLAQIVGTTAKEVEFVIEQYKDLLDGNRSLLVRNKYGSHEFLLSANTFF